MRVAIDVSQVIYGTGVSVYVKNLVYALSRLVGDDDQLVLFGGSLRRKSQLDRWINRLPARSGNRDHLINKTNHLSPQLINILWNSFHLLPAEIITGKVDLIHTSDWAEPPAKTPKVTTVHDLNFFKDPSYSHPQVRAVHTKRLYWVQRESAQIIAVSQATKQDLIKYLNIDPDRIDVIYEGPSISAPPVASYTQRDLLKAKFGLTKPYLFVPGSGHPRKNIARLVQALAQLKLDYQLLIAGRPSDEERKLASAKVIFSGYLTDADWASLISLSEALIYPSLYEGFGVPILDAFVCSVPVLTSKVSSMPEIAGNAAVLVNPESVESIAAGIIETLESKNALIELGHTRLSRFSWEETARQTLKLYQRTIT